MDASYRARWLERRRAEMRAERAIGLATTALFLLAAALVVADWGGAWAALFALLQRAGTGAAETVIAIVAALS